MKELRVNTNSTENAVFTVKNGHNVFNQLAVKIDMNGIEDVAYFEWLDNAIETTMSQFPQTKFLEKDGARSEPPLNTAVYYDTIDYQLLPTGALLRTSCNVKTHAFCAFKMPEDAHGNRLDRRHVFQGSHKKTIQQMPYSDEAIAIVKELLLRTDIEHPGVFLKQVFDIDPTELYPAMVLFGQRSTFYVLLEDYDILRCSLDRSRVFDFRTDINNRVEKEFREVELSIYPRISKNIMDDKRIIEIMTYLQNSLIKRFNTRVIYDIKYQRGAKLLHII